MTFETQNDNIFMGFKSEVMRMTLKKLGRPTDNPKSTQFSVRFDKETLEILDKYCKENAIPRPEGVREAVRKLKKK